MSDFAELIFKEMSDSIPEYYESRSNYSPMQEMVSQEPKQEMTFQEPKQEMAFQEPNWGPKQGPK